MTRIALGTADQQHVANMTIPDFEELPKMVIWGERAFMLRKVNERPDSTALYSEVFAVVLDDETMEEGGG